jgi:RNA polymerase sigma factor (sigma-70 family)
MPNLAAADSDDQLIDAPPGATVAAPIRPSDSERLMRFCRHGDEAAFAEIVKAHAALVWGVCSQVLRHQHDIEDAFQATFLILARKAKSIRTDSVAGWLYRVAFRTALLARDRRTRQYEVPLLDDPISDDDHFAELARREQCFALLEELHALPARYREPLVLCYFEGRSRRDSATQLGVTQQAVKGRLARGMRLLRSRMVRRGVTFSAAIAATRTAMAAAKASATPALVSKTVSSSLAFATKSYLMKGVAAATSQGAVQASFFIGEKGMIAMTIAAVSKPAVGVLGVCLTAGMLAVRAADVPPAGSSGGGGGIVAVAAGGGGSPSAEAAAGAEDQAKAEKAAIAADEAPKAQEAKEAEVAVSADAKKAEMTNDSDPFAAKAEVEARRVAQDVLIQTPAAGAIAMAGEVPVQANFQDFNLRMAAPNPFQFVNSGVSFDQPNRTSTKSLKLEGEYWSLKADGLQKKAEALQIKAKSLSEAGRGSQVEVLEAQADAQLALAEVKMCLVNSLRIKESLEAAEAGQLKTGAKGMQVRALQELLNAKLQPSPKLDVDGDFGPLTEQAVKDFQKKHQLEATGVVDEQTGRALGFGGIGVVAGNAFFNPAVAPVPTIAPLMPARPAVPATPAMPRAAIRISPRVEAAAQAAAAKQQEMAALQQQVDALKKAKEDLERQAKELEEQFEESK